jgi:type I restriction-modification system DNA methylase subunit
MYLNYKDYLTRWKEIADVFSKEAVMKGSFDKYAESAKVKKGTAGVDAAFLAEIDSWRQALAQNIALRNPKLSQRELNFSVGKTIDRIIFLRICEDRGIEPEGRLMGLQNGVNIYQRLIEIYYSADDKYNSGLFHFKQEKERSAPPDDLTLTLSVDDKIFKDIFKSLYYPESPYEFSVLPADILGQVYEQFLGKVIHLTPGHRAKVEEKPEVRKAGGVYYTPTYIVDYIVKNTVGKLLDGKTPKTAQSLRILDPACGSGSFLIGAYQYLLDWHRDIYVDDDPEKYAKGKNPALYQKIRNEWRLTTAERKRILLNNIYGVDIDPQAVEVTKLSLLLKVLEGESDQTIKSSFKLFHERALPDLGNNIKCGNSLIGPDYYEGKQTSFLDTEEMQRVNAFDWEKEFPEIFKSGGFDAVIGNPPYIRIQALQEWAPTEVEFYKQNYKAASKGNYDIYVVFVEKGLQLLNKNGRLGFILPHKFFNAQYGEPLRKIIADGRHLAEVIHFGDKQVFANATTYTCLLFLEKHPRKYFFFHNARDIDAWRDSMLQVSIAIAENIVSIEKVVIAEWNFTSRSDARLYDRLASMPSKLVDMANIFVGLQTSADTVFLFKDSSLASSQTTKAYSKQLDAFVEIDSELLKPVIRSGNIGRYWATPNALVLFPYHSNNEKFSLIPEKIFESQYENTWAYLLENKKCLSQREHGKFLKTGWYQLYPKNLDLWEQPKILVPYMITRLSAYYDDKNYYFVNVTTGGFGVTIKSDKISYLYLTGLLNSLLLDWFFKKVSTTFHGGYYAANKQFLAQLPIRPIDFKNFDEKKKHDHMVQLVEQMLALHKQLAEAKTDHEKTLIQRQIDATDKQIDKLVYELYDLTEDEIKIVEGQ